MAEKKTYEEWVAYMKPKQQELRHQAQQLVSDMEKQNITPELWIKEFAETGSPAAFLKHLQAIYGYSN